LIGITNSLDINIRLNNKDMKHASIFNLTPPGRPVVHNKFHEETK